MDKSGGDYHILMREMADTVADWAREEQRDGKSLIENDGVLARLAKVYADARISEVLSGRVLGTKLAGLPDLAYGPAAKVYSTEACIFDSTDLPDLAAPKQLVRGPAVLGLIAKLGKEEG